MNPKNPSVSILQDLAHSGGTDPPKPNSCLTVISFPEPYTFRIHTVLTLYGYIVAHLAPRILVYIYTVLLQEETLFIWSLVPAKG